MSRLRMFSVVSVMAIVAGLVGAGGAVWASHQYGDVPDSNPFHDQIGAITDSCIATGYGDGGFHPAGSVSRQAMAAFLARGLGRLEVADAGVTTLPGNDLGTITAPLPLASVSVDIPDLGTCQQYVELIGTATADIPDLLLNACNAQRCEVYLELYEGATLLGSTLAGFSGNFDADSMTVTAAVPAIAGAHTYTLSVKTWLLKANKGSAENIRLIASTHPFSSTAR